MSGHNKFSQIKRQKGLEDGKKSKLFSMFGRQITIQTRLAGGDENSPGPRKIIEIARKSNMPNDTFDRAVKRGKEVGGESLEEVVYEAFGPGGVAIIMQGITDSKNRTSQEIKHILSDQEVALGTPGSAMWAFASSRSDSGEITYSPTTKVPLEQQEEKTKLASLVQALENHEDIKSVTTNAE